jgi:hypothetical protein
MVTAFSGAFLPAPSSRSGCSTAGSQPLDEISTAARAIAAGHVATMPAFDTAELGHVADAIDSMQRSLSDERDRAIRS